MDAKQVLDLLAIVPLSLYNYKLNELKVKRIKSA